MLCSARAASWWSLKIRLLALAVPLLILEDEVVVLVCMAEKTGIVVETDVAATLLSLR